MGKGKIDVDVDLNGVDKKIKSAIKSGIRHSSTELYDEGTKVAKSKLRQEGAIWKGELINSFTFRTTPGGKVRLVKIENTADHARPMEEGAEYEEEGPPLSALIPWVETELSQWQVSDYWIYRARRALGFHPSQFQANKEVYAKAFWLQQKIKKQGLDAREFMEAMKKYLEQNADRIVGHEIDKKLRSRL